MTARKTLVRSVEEEDLESGVWEHKSEGQSFDLSNVPGLVLGR